MGTPSGGEIKGVFYLFFEMGSTTAQMLMECREHHQHGEDAHLYKKKVN